MNYSANAVRDALAWCSWLDTIPVTEWDRAIEAREAEREEHKRAAFKEKYGVGHRVVQTEIKHGGKAMFAAQRGLCGICAEPLGSVRGKYCFDHCHVTGIYRGWLCASCNVRLGWFERRRNAVLAWASKTDIFK